MSDSLGPPRPENTMREFDLLQHVYRSNARLARSRTTVLIPPGDDMAMVEISGSRLLAAVDQLVAGRHVLLDTTPLELVGRKAITRSLSDIAAMAATPLATLVAVTLPPNFGEDRANCLFDAMRETADEFNCPLIGGDIAFHDDNAFPLVCAVTVLAQPASTDPITRSGAKPGDLVYVTGKLGGSIAHDGSGKHLTFNPRIDEAVELASNLRENLHAMIDISDGLGRDAAHLAAQSNVIIELDAAAIPCNDNIDWKRALSDGEDYELCFTAAPDANVPQRIGPNADLTITRIGRVLPLPTGEQPRCIVTHNGQPIDASELGWQHESS